MPAVGVHCSFVPRSTDTETLQSDRQNQLFSVWRIENECKKNFSDPTDTAAGIRSLCVGSLRRQRPFERGKNAKPSFFDQGLALNASGALAGLGNADVLVTLEATAFPGHSTRPQFPQQSKAQTPHLPGAPAADFRYTGSIPDPTLDWKIKEKK